MASLRKPVINKQQKPFVNGTTSDTKYKSRSGILVPNRVFVGGICPTATENDLINLFGKYGSVKEVKIISDQNGSSKGYGFITYEKADDVTRLQNDAKNLIFNNRPLNIAPAVMKNPPYMGRDSYVVPVTPSNIYFTNTLPYQYQEGNTVYPNSPYPPPLTVLPAVSDAAYYPNGYNSSSNFIPTTPYQGAALFYPVPHNTSPVMVGPQPYSSSYQSVTASNNSYAYSSPTSVTSSPPSTTAKTTSTTSTTNASEVHGSHGTQIVPTMPPNVSSMPPPLPYPLTHSQQYYNGSVAPPYSGEVYYNMVHGACYPMMTVSGHEAYIPYYDVAEPYNNNVQVEENNCEPQNYHVNAIQSYSEINGKDTSPPSINDGKQIIPMVMPPTSTEHVSDSYTTENSSQIPPSTPQTPMHTQHHSGEYGPSAYIQHRSAAIIYPNTPIAPPNIYFNSVYMTEATAASTLTPCVYPKNLSDQYVSDHLPKRDTKYAQKKFSPVHSQTKDNPPNIPKFPFFVNNNYPAFVHRSVKDKDIKNGNAMKIMENNGKQPLKPPRVNGNGILQPRGVYHNQGQHKGIPRPPRNGNTQTNPMNVQYIRSNSTTGPSKSVTYEQPQNTRPYEYQNSHQTHTNYQKNTNYENHYKKQGQPGNHGGPYRGKYEKANGQSVNETSYTKAPSDDRPSKKYPQNEEVTVTSNECPPTSEQNIAALANTNVQQAQQQVCAEMQNLTL